MATQPQLGAAPQSVFVGRLQELSALEEELQHVREGRPRVVLVEGAAGIGKTALIERFLARVDDVTVLRASGDESERDLPFGVLEQLLRRAGDAGATASAAITSRPARTCWSGSARSTDEHPVVVVIDDAHWADAASLRALLFVVRRLVADRVLIVIATREDPVTLPEGLLKAAAGADGRRLVLRPFTADELRALAAGPRRPADGARGAPAAGARRRQPALLARAAGRAARRRLAPPGQPARAALVRRASSGAASRPARPTPRGCSRRVAVLGPHGPLATAADAGRASTRRSTRSRRPSPPDCCAWTTRAACPRPRSRIR